MKAEEAHKMIQAGMPLLEACGKAGLNKNTYYKWRRTIEKRELRASKIQGQVIAAANIPAEEKIAVVLKVRPSDLYKLLAYV